MREVAKRMLDLQLGARQGKRGTRLAVGQGMTTGPVGARFVLGAFGVNLNFYVLISLLARISWPQTYLPGEEKLMDG